MVKIDGSFAVVERRDDRWMVSGDVVIGAAHDIAAVPA